jgi:hypothetical protein
MRPARHWYELSSARRDRERHQLANIPYFTLERTTTNANRIFLAIGTLHFIARRSGKEHGFRIRLAYPSRFPQEPPRVYDHDKRFTPTLDGHQFRTHELCLTMNERGEFATGSDRLTQEVLGATLIWFHKRLIFDRTKQWPGLAEKHGINAVIDLLVERRVVTDATAISDWLLSHASTPAGSLRAPDIYALCPCGSGKRLKFCHRDDLQLIFNRLAVFPTDWKLADVLGRKDGGS